MIPPYYGFTFPAGGGPSPPANSDFSYWFDGQPLVGEVDGNQFDYWNDGQAIVEEGT